MPAPTTDTYPMFSSREACDLAAITYRQLDYWCRIGTAPCVGNGNGSGSRRRWTRRQVLVLAVLGLAGGHLPISQLGEVANLLHEWPDERWATTTLLVDRNGVWLSDDGAGELPPVAIAINLPAICRLVADRAAQLGRA